MCNAKREVCKSVKQRLFFFTHNSISLKAEDYADGMHGKSDRMHDHLSRFGTWFDCDAFSSIRLVSYMIQLMLASIVVQ